MKNLIMMILKYLKTILKVIFKKSLFEYQGNKFILLFNDSTDDNVSLFILDEANKLIEQPNEMFKTLLKKGEFAVNFSKNDILAVILHAVTLICNMVR